MTGIGIGVMDAAVLSGGPAPASANISAIDIDGWQATVVTVPNEFDPVNSPDTFFVTRQGFNAAGAAVSVLDTVTLTRRIRQPFPLENQKTADLGAASDYIYAKDTIAGVVNNSNFAYPPVIPRWAHPDFEIVQSSTFRVYLAVAHPFYRSGKMIAHATITLSDGTTSQTVTSGGMAARTSPATNVVTPCMYFDVDFSLFNLGTVTVTEVNLKPWVGDEYTLTSNGDVYNSANFCPIKFFNDYNQTQPWVYARVNGVGGGTPQASTDQATTSANPFATLDAAAAAAYAINSTLSGCIIEFEAGSYTGLGGTWDALSVDIDGMPVIVRGLDAAAVNTTTIVADTSTANDDIPDRVRFHWLGIDVTVATARFIDGNATSNVLYQTHLLQFIECKFNFTLDYFAAMFGYGILELVDNTGVLHGENLKQFSSQVSLFRLLVGNNLDTISRAGTNCGYGLLGNELTNFGTLITHSATASFQPPVGALMGWNKVSLNISSGGKVFNVQDGITPLAGGVAIVGNLVENIGGLTAAMIYIFADGSTDNIENAYVFHNTIAGDRLNLIYNSMDATRYLMRGLYFKDNVCQSWNIKADLFNNPTNGGQNGARTGNWSVVNHVGWKRNLNQQGSASSNYPAYPGAWDGEWYQLDEVPSSPVPNPDFVNDASRDGTGLGGGDYTPGPATDIPLIPAGQTMAPVDLLGRAINTDGTAHAGAVQ